MRARARALALDFGASPVPNDESAYPADALSDAVAEARDGRLDEPLAPATMKNDFAVSGQKSQEGLIQYGTDQVQCMHVLYCAYVHTSPIRPPR